MTALSAFWSQLSADIQAGKYTTANLGEIIEVDNTALDDVGLAAGRIQFKIVAIDNANLVDTTKTHSITLMATKVLFAKEFNSTLSNIWGTSEIRSYLQNNFINILDPSCVYHIAKVSRSHDVPGGSPETVQDTVFLPSLVEIGLRVINSSVVEGVCFNIMSNTNHYGGAANERIVEGNGSNSYLLSSANGSYTRVEAVNCSDGSQVQIRPTDITGICPCFVLA